MCLRSSDWISTLPQGTKFSMRFLLRKIERRSSESFLINEAKVKLLYEAIMTIVKYFHKIQGLICRYSFHIVAVPYLLVIPEISLTFVRI